MNRKQRRQAAVSRRGGAAGILAPGAAQARLVEGRRLMRAGRLAEAKAIAQQVLKAAPNDGYALHLLGSIAGLAGSLDEASRRLKRAAEVLPNEPVVHLDLGTAYQGLGDTVGAAEAYGRAAALKPDLVAAHMGLGNALKAERRFEEAEAAYRRVTELAPELADGFANLGEVLKELDRPNEAIVSFEKAVSLNPGLARAHAALGILLWRQDRTKDGFAAFERALDADPTYLEVHAIIGNLLLEQDRGLLAEAPFRALLARRPGDPRAHEGLGRALDLQGRHHEALEHYRKAIALDPARSSLHIALADSLARQDRMDEAHSVCEQAIAAGIDVPAMLARRSDFFVQQGEFQKAAEMARRAQEADPRGWAGVWQLAAMTKVERGSEILELLESLAEKHGRSNGADGGALEFSLAKAYNDVGDYDEAFRWLEAGNRKKRSTIRFNIDAAERSVHQTAEFFNSELIGAFENAGCDSELPVFIVGMPRSGTTLTEQILASHPMVHGAGELSDFTIALNILDDPTAPPKSMAAIAESLTPALCRQIGERYVEILRNRDSGAMRITDKMPFNCLRLGMIHLALPKARILHCNRDPVDTCLSCFQQPFRQGNRFAYDLAELGRYYRAYRGLMEHWRTVLPPGRILEVNYEDLVSDVEGQARRLVDHCGLPWDDACLSFHKAERQVRTASVRQVRQPIYRSSVAKWRKYEKHLGPLLTSLGDLAGPTAGGGPGE
ncbi:MAG: tetratricopeptide repeat protein [Inquilinus sp.]|nr:tetratricopeptide repeat protein [Inquilinus sp.]